jgi:hypothetical protein
MVHVSTSFDDVVHAFEPAAQTCSRGIFASTAWFRNLLAHGFAGTPQALWLVGRDEGPHRAAVALGLRREGRTLHSLSNYYSSLYAPIGSELQAGAALWRAIACELRRQGGQVVQLQPLAADAEWSVQLARAMRSAGYWVGHFFCFGNWYLRVEGRSAADHFKALPSALRHSVERGRRRLSREGAWSIEIQAVEGPGLERSLADYVAVYARSWKQPEPSAEFMPGLLRTAAREKWLRLGVLRLKGEPLAAQVWLVCGGVANIYKLAYVEGFERYSPGSVLTAALMAHVIDVDRVEEVDYLTGDDAYKRDWMGARRERVGLIAFDAWHWRGWVAALRHYMPRAWRWARARVWRGDAGATRGGRA